MLATGRDLWLPKAFSFLSGLPGEKRRRRKLVPMQAFVDDSGHKGGPPHFVLAGLVAPAENWAAFSEEWAACLSETPAIPIFKMREAAGRNGHFRHFTEKERDDKVRRLAKIINRYADFYTYSIIDLSAHAETWGTLALKPHHEPYFWPFHTTIMATCFQLWDLGWRERFEIFFDEQVIFGPRAKLWYPVVREVINYKEPEASQILPIDPVFRTDDEFLPIQAADLFAWWIRRNFDTPLEPSFAWLVDEFSSLKGTEYSQYYDRERMQAVFDEGKRLASAGEFPDEISRAYKSISEGR